MPSYKKLAITGLAVLIALVHEFRMLDTIDALVDSAGTPMVKASVATAKVYVSMLGHLVQIYAYDRLPAQATVQVNKLVTTTSSLLTASHGSITMLTNAFRMLWAIMTLLEMIMLPLTTPAVIFLAKTTMVTMFLYGFAFIAGCILAVFSFFL